MQEEIRQAQQLGADGIVLGVLDEKGRVDLARSKRLVELAAPLPVTFHRAIDMTPDLVAALESVIATGASRVLTSGGAPDVTRGMAEIARMVQAAKGRIVIMPGGGVSADNIVDLAHATGAGEFHSSARTSLQSPVQFRKQGIAMGDIPDSEYKRYIVREESVRALVGAIERLDVGRALNKMRSKS
jgi:copper homeostasis protein